MNTERLLALYDHVADAPDAVARLRRFVLDLAVRGRLVEQDPEDEPASVLLERIAAEKVRLAKAKEIRNIKVSSIESADYPYLIPTKWVWTRLGMIGDWGSGSTPSRSNPDLYGGGVTWLKSGELGDRLYIKGSNETITEKAIQSGSFRRNQPGDILMAMYGATIGKLAILAEEATTNQAVCGCSPFTGVFNQFLFLFLLARRPALCASSEGGAQPNISKVKIVGTPFSLPPLAEQRRIVARVEELTTLLDRLEAARNVREATRDRLTAASLVRLTAPNTTAEDVPAHARFALDALPVLTIGADQIKLLRQTILNLAVRGRLVEQNPADEPASDLLVQIVEAKATAKSETGDARIKPAPTPDPEKLRMVLPFGWSVESFENLFLFIDYRGKTPPKTSEGIPLITAKNVRMGRLKRDPREFISKTTFNTWMTRGFPRLGDLFFTTEAPLANVCINDIEESFALAQRVICLQPYAELNTRYLMFAIMSDVIQGLIDEYSTGLTAKGIKAAKLKPLPVPLPPLAEQHRIVAKVDALMALCDRLDSALHKADTTRACLLDALIHEALSPATPDAHETAA